MALSNPGERAVRLIKAAVFAVALIPLGKVATLGLMGQLGANPIERITHATGWWTLTFLLLTLAVTPLRRLSGWSWWGRLRRMLGLYAFFYASLHFLTYLVLDQYFDWPAIVKDIAKRPYVTVGFAAYLLLIPLAATSTDAMVRRLGGWRWRLLHRAGYVIAAAGVLHFIWLVKKDLTRPATMGAWLALLLGIRLAYWKRGLARSRALARSG
ncbi:MAG: sulfoxide reductase heme-binding subunit YedZ [Methylococcaceae bacterium]|nr:sulfoxide reductase heme-binding subunit YedZ [Methylococcaceae bacterium]